MHATPTIHAYGQPRFPTIINSKPGRTVACLAALLVACAGCGGGSNNGGRELALPSLDFWLRANAAGEEEGLTVECGLDYIVDIAGEVSRTDQVVEYVGTMGGEARRSILRPDGSGFAIFADAFSEVQVLLLAPDRVQINAINVPPDPEGVSSRFWNELLKIEGRLTDDQIVGDWVCAPLDTEINGINDNTVVIPGMWFSE
ncbi:MAG: hypothetical protein KJP03_04455, partial [Gammaproteobacteria bacterium]|nr:hypothetical protein [Gammaproteobacteria bacterium]